MIRKETDGFGRRANERLGELIVVDGLDGIGKGVIERVMIEYEQKLDRAVFDTVAHSKACENLPELEDFWNPPIPHYNTIVTAEPTFAGIGKTIREEIIAKKGRKYGARTQIQAYSIDREVLLERVSIPARRHGIREIKSRSFISTCNYQAIEAAKDGWGKDSVRKYILEQEGTKLSLMYAPNLFIIPTMDNIEEVLDRLEKRKATRKDDKSIFDNFRFQEKLKPLYEERWVKNILTAHGCQVVYLNAGISEDETRRQTIEIYKSFLENKEIPERYFSVKSVLK